MALGAGLVLVGSFLPWVTARVPLLGSISKTGLEGSDGIITLVLGSLMLLGALRGLLTDFAWPSWFRFLSYPASLAAIVVAVLNMRDVSQRIGNIESDLVSANIGAGLWTLLIGAVLGAIGSWPKAIGVPWIRRHSFKISLGVLALAALLAFLPVRGCGPAFLVAIGHPRLPNVTEGVSVAPSLQSALNDVEVGADNLFRSICWNQSKGRIVWSVLLTLLGAGLVGNHIFVRRREPGAVWQGATDA